MSIPVSLVAIATLLACYPAGRLHAAGSAGQHRRRDAAGQAIRQHEGRRVTSSAPAIRSACSSIAIPTLAKPVSRFRPDGRISTPLIDDITAAGKTPTQLAHELEDRLKKYIQDPTVTVIVRSFVGPEDRQVKVIGEATDPQAIPYRDGMTLLDVMIATKGLTKYAAGNRAVIIRRDAKGKQETIHVSLSDLMKYGDISKNVDMEPGDTLIIPQSWF